MLASENDRLSSLRWPRFLPHPALVFVVLSWGLNFSVIKLAYRDFSAPAVALLRFLGMVPFLLLAVRLTGGSLVPKSRAMRTRLLWGGFLGSGAYMILFLEGMARTGAAQGAITLATAPIWISLFAVLLGQEESRWTLAIGSLLAFLGVAVVVLAGGNGAGGTILGTILVLASAVVWAVSVVVLRPALAETDAISALTIGFPMAGLVLIPYGARAVYETDWAAVTGVGWVSLAYLVIVAGVLAFAAYYRGIAVVGPARTSMTQFFIPPTAAFFAWVVLGQPLNIWQLVGLAIVVLGVIIGSRRPRQNEGPAAEKAGLAQE